MVFALGAGHEDRGGAGLARDYLYHGVWHILTGFDHLLFIAALALAAVTLRDLVKVLSVFTLAHSMTLVLSVLDILRVSSRLVEPMIAASIVFIAVQNVFHARASRGNGRLAIAFFFGLFHGLGFAGGLLDAMQGLGGLSVGLAIGAFSLGVECGHLGVVLPVFLVMHALRTPKVRPAIPLGVMRAGSCAIAIAGAGYFIAACQA
ncbi:hypothetical protein IMCC26134_09070 [Verrucomicrobia bacterium IMCC26134]|nr:hypothetical protein IMCC26134_09070 [Verrucomicrobia bacterium IMCC26134]